MKDGPLIGSKRFTHIIESCDAPSPVPSIPKPRDSFPVSRFAALAFPLLPSLPASPSRSSHLFLVTPASYLSTRLSPLLTKTSSFTPSTSESTMQGAHMGASVNSFPRPFFCLGSPAKSAGILTPRWTSLLPQSRQP